MEYGKRIIYNPETGTVLNNNLDEATGSLITDLRPKTVEFIDLPYGHKVNGTIEWQNVLEYKIDVSTKDIVLISYLDTETWNVVYVDNQ